MSGLQGALGVAQLKRLENFVDKRIANAKLYNDLLSRAGDQVTLPPESKDVKNVYWMYSILLKSKASRDGMMKFLKSKGVETRTFFYPIHHQPYYASRYSNMTFPVSDSLSDRGVNLPSGNQLTEDEIRYVCENILEYLKGEKS